MRKALINNTLNNSAAPSSWGRGAAQRGLGPLARRSNAASGFLFSLLLTSQSVFFLFLSFVSDGISHIHLYPVQYGYRLFYVLSLFFVFLSIRCKSVIWNGEKKIKRESYNYKRETFNYLARANKGTGIIKGDIHNYSVIYG